MKNINVLTLRNMSNELQRFVLSGNYIKKLLRDLIHF